MSATHYCESCAAAIPPSAPLFESPTGEVYCEDCASCPTDPDPTDPPLRLIPPSEGQLGSYIHYHSTAEWCQAATLRICASKDQAEAYAAELRESLRYGCNARTVKVLPRTVRAARCRLQVFVVVEYKRPDEVGGGGGEIVIERL